MRDEKLYRHLSGLYLTDSIPFDWNDLSIELQNEYIAEHIWEPFENWEPKAVIELIDDAYEHIKPYIQNEITAFVEEFDFQPS